MLSTTHPMSFVRRSVFSACVAAATFIFLSIGQSSMANDGIPSEVQEKVPNAKVVGEKMFTYYFWDVYRASLFAPNGEYEEGGVFALKLNYQRELEGKKIAQRSIDEMKKQADLSKEKADKWLNSMETIFPDVSDGHVLTGIATEDGSTVFYSNGEEIGSVDDSEFTTSFFNIWLGEKTSEPKFRKALLGL